MPAPRESASSRRAGQALNAVVGGKQQLPAAPRLIIRNLAAWLTAAAALGSLFAGCGSGSAASSGATTATAVSTVPPGRAAQVVMRSLAFNPPAVHAKVGQKVTWINEDNAP